MQLSQLAKSFEEFKTANDERLKQIEVKGKSDPLTEQRLSNITKEMDEYKNALSNISTSLNRPILSGIETSSCKSALSSYARSGVNLQTKALSSSNDSEGGYLVDRTTSKNILAHIAANSVMRKLASIEEISTNSLEVLSEEGKFTAGWVGEMESRPATGSSKLHKTKIEVHEIYAQPRATQKLLDDARIDVAKWLSEKIADKFAAIESDAFINGDGINKPKGILSYTDVETVLYEKVITEDDLLKLYYSLDSSYSAHGCFLMHRNMIQRIRGFKCGTTGQYLWTPGLALETPDTLLGAPIYECADMPFADGKAVIAFADFKQAYKIVDRTNINIMKDPFTEKPFVKFYATKRVGGAVINSKALSLLRAV